MVHRVLVVDDDKDLREAIFEQFQLHDEFSVTMVENASQALDKARGNEADIVLLDVDLPDMDGREACRRMRKDGFKGVVIMLTGSVTDNLAAEAFKRGARDYVLKKGLNRNAIDRII
ncbi:MAG: response regulator, partial [Pseudomonadota bacterium]